MPNRPPGASGPRFTVQLTGLDYALPGTLARRFMRCGKTNADARPTRQPFTGPTCTGPAPSPARPSPAASPPTRPAATKPGSTTPAGSATSSASSRPVPYARSKTPRADPVNAEISPSRSAERKSDDNETVNNPRTPPTLSIGDGTSFNDRYLIGKSGHTNTVAVGGGDRGLCAAEDSPAYEA